VPIPIIYDGIKFDEALRLDVIVDDLVICELKAVEEIKAIFTTQLLTQLTEILDIHINHCYDCVSSHFLKSAVLLKPCYHLIRYSNIYKNCRIFCFFNFADFTGF
jgi:hypothetical protein